MRRRGFLTAGLFLFLRLASPIFPQDLYWEDPEILVSSGGRYPQAQTGGGVTALVWQETVSRGSAGGESFLSIRVSRDGKTWTENRRFAGPYSYLGNPSPIFSLAVNKEGTIHVAVLAGENTIQFLVSRDGGATFTTSSIKTVLPTTLAPRLFITGSGGFLLFVTQELGDVLALYYTVSDTVTSWPEPRPLAPETDLTLSFLPHHVSFQGREYVVFQALRAGEGAAYQLFLRISGDGGTSWGPLVWLSGFAKGLSGETYLPAQVDNQRPFLADVDGRIGVTWERRSGRELPQIHYMEIDGEGRILSAAEKVTGGFQAANFPQILRYRDRTFLLWFDNRKGADHIFIADKQGVFWNEKDLSPMEGGSTFPRPVIQGEELRIFWENRRGDQSRIVQLKPDTTVEPPVVTPLTYTAGKRSRGDLVRYRWTLPRDSSGIEGFSYLWTRDRDAQVPQKTMVLENTRTAEFQAPEDGTWYFHLAARDYAGNWSAQRTTAYVRDREPPGPVEFPDPEKDELGYLVSNSIDLVWKAPPDDDVAGYTYAFRRIGESRDALLVRDAAPLPLPRTVMTREPRMSLRNNDDGLWALDVAAVDEVGNVGPGSTLFVHLNKHVPETVITFVDAVKDSLGAITLSIIGRGFAVDGQVSEVILDRDGRLPYDYVFSRSSGDYRVRDDRRIVGPAVAEIRDGSYRVGVRHPLRGIVFARNPLSMESPGTIKYGDFNVYYDPLWKPLRRPPIMLTGNALAVWIVVVFLACAAFFSVLRLGDLVTEGRRLRLEAVALITGDNAHWAKKQERILAMKKKGIGLRVKFTLFITMLIISVVLMVSIPLGFYMTTNQERNLAEGLFQRASVLLESLSTGARTYLPSGNTLELGILPLQTSAMSEARFATITGRSVSDVAARGFVWATNDKKIGGKIDTGEVVPGESRMKDDISPLEETLAREIDEAARGGLRETAAELDRIGGELRRLATRNDPESRNRFQDLQKRDSVLRGEIDEVLAKLGRTVHSQPGFSTDLPDYSGLPWLRGRWNMLRDLFSKRILDRRITDYTFYKPVLYRIAGVDSYYRGLVRLGVSTEEILREVETSGKTLVLITAVVALAALVVGVFGALVLASITIIPIRRLVQGVERIRDTEDKEDLRDHVIDVRTRDEISILADTINQMTQGLVRAAAASKDLTVGKEIQKMFIPLEIGPGGKKLTTGKSETSDGEFFGYYEGAKGVSGDYFEFRRLEEDNYAFIKCDVAGKGVPAALIMVQVATVFTSYFKNLRIGAGPDMVPLLYQINDVLESQGFKGRFAAMTLGIVNVKTGRIHVTHAGDRVLRIYEAKTRSLKRIILNDCPATGVFPNFMIEMKTPFEQVQLPLNPGDIMMLFTDGVDEAHRKLRKPNFDILQLPPEKEGDDPVEDEMMGEERIREIIEAVMNRRVFRLEKQHNPVAGEELVFDFSGCEPSAENVVTALVSVEKIFRIYPDPRAGAGDRIMMDRKIDDFLKKTFSLYGRYFARPLENPNPGDFPNYNFYSHIMEDDQYDDLTLMAIRKK